MIAEALARRKDLGQKIADLTTRITQNGLVVKGEVPTEDQRSLLEELTRLHDERETIIIQINHANIKHGLMERAIRRNKYRALEQLYRQAANTSRSSLRYGRDELVYEPTIPVAELADKANAYAELARGEDLEIQMIDWNESI